MHYQIELKRSEPTHDQRWTAAIVLITFFLALVSQEVFRYLPRTGANLAWKSFWICLSLLGLFVAYRFPPKALLAAGTVLPLAEPALHTEDPVSRRLTVYVFGSAPASASVFEDDGGMPPKLTEVRLSWDAARRHGSVQPLETNPGPHYEVSEWKLIN